MLTSNQLLFINYLCYGHTDKSVKTGVIYIELADPFQAAVLHQEVEKESAQENSLLDGEYDEKEAAQSFQQALAEWRKENTDSDSVVVTSNRSIKQVSFQKPTQLVTQKPTQLGTKKPNVQIVSPVHTPSK